MERCHLLAIQVSHIFHYLTEGSVIHVHVRDIDETGQLIFLAKFPCLLGADFNAGLAVNYDDSCSCGADCLFHFSHEIKITRCINNIDLVSFPLNGDHGGTDREMTFLFFFTVIAEGIAVIYLAHTGGDTGQISKGFCKTGLATAAMAQ